MVEVDWAAQSPDLRLMQHLWEKLERRQGARPYRPTSVVDLTVAFVAESEQIPAARFQNLVESLKTEEVEQ